ncbi:MAG: tRNA pseudouridine(55) synthase TruB [Pseudolysinimonas sp.]
MSPSGILLVDKPGGMTSHDVVSRTRKALGTRKVGHAGTLDPMATGLLLLGVDSSTRLLTYLVGLGKRYRATIRLGAATDTDDAEGGQISTADTSGITRDQIDAAVAPLTGDIQQVPSTFSAIKVGGRRSYDRARAGEDVVLEPRSVTVSRFDVLGETRVASSAQGGECTDLDVMVECSSGTYIRALARDLGTALGVGGHLTALRREAIGGFEVQDAVQLGAIDAGALRSPAAIAGTLFPTASLDASQATDLTHGKRVRLDIADAPVVAAVTADGRLAGLVAVTEGSARVLVNFPADEVLA